MVGGAWICAKSANVTMPSRNVSGSSSVSRRAALTAAVSRSGSTSSAFIEPEMSVTMITVAARCGAATVRCGRASAIDQRGEREQDQQRREVAAPARAGL